MHGFIQEDSAASILAFSSSSLSLSESTAPKSKDRSSHSFRCRQWGENKDCSSDKVDGIKNFSAVG